MNINKPFANSYCVIPDKVYAGEYAGDKVNPQQKASLLKQFGITHIIDLTEEGELKPYAHLLGPDIVHRRFPVKDVSVPASPRDVYDLMKEIESIISTPGNKVYIHCWGGVGRTGTIVACLYEYLGEAYDAALDHLRSSFADCPKSQWRKTPETQEQLDFIRAFGEFVKFPFEVAAFEEVINWTLPGLQFFYRDTQFDGNLDILAKAYNYKGIFRAGFFIDCTSRAAKPVKNVRFIIASAHTAQIWQMKMMDDEPVMQWRLCVLDYNSYFKVVDTYRVGDQLQILLLHIPLKGIPMFANFGNINIGDDEDLTTLARRSFDSKLQMEPLPWLEADEWTRRTEMYPGFDENGWAPFDPAEPTNAAAADLHQLILKLSNDKTDLNKA